jgi:hypothetical protein
MRHANAPLTVEGRRRLVERCRTRPIAHVAAEMGISRACIEAGQPLPPLRGNRPARPFFDTTQPTRRDRRHGRGPNRRPPAQPEVVSVADRVRTPSSGHHRQPQHSDPAPGEARAEPSQVHRPEREQNREPRRVSARWPGHLVHVDVNKVGRIPDGGGWRVHGRRSERAKNADRLKKSKRGGYVYLHSAVDGFSRLAYPEALPDERAVTAIAFMHRARAWFAAHGITHIERIVTDNGACYRADAFARALLGSRHQRITPYTPRHERARWSATTGSWQRSSFTPVNGTPKTNEQPPSACGTSTTTTTGLTAPLAASHQRHDSKAVSPTCWPPTAGSRDTVRDTNSSQLVLENAATGVCGETTDA